MTWNVILGYDHEGIFPGSLELGGIYVSSRGKAICLLNLNIMDGTMNGISKSYYKMSCVMIILCYSLCGQSTFSADRSESHYGVAICTPSKL